MRQAYNPQLKRHHHQHPWSTMKKKSTFNHNKHNPMTWRLTTKMHHTSTFAMIGRYKPMPCSRTVCFKTHDNSTPTFSQKSVWTLNFTPFIKILVGEVFRVMRMV